MTLDLPGHGDAASISASLPEIAALVLDALPDEPLALGGYSFGGRVALHVALRAPARLNAVVVLGASRGIADLHERAERLARDEALARHLDDVGTAQFLEEWLTQPLFARLGPRSEPESRSGDARGLADSLRRAGTGTQEWLGPQLVGLAVPTLAIAGDADAKFTAEARAIADTVVDGHFAAILDAGHAAHLEQPERTAEVIEGFLDTRN
jgi:2-succinyl-6-hydroxy-2,4-cyclohexadiene-1-carboxylate synthase